MLMDTIAPCSKAVIFRIYGILQLIKFIDYMFTRLVPFQNDEHVTR